MVIQLSRKKRNRNMAQLSFSIPVEEKKMLMTYAEMTRRSMTKVLRDYIFDIGEKLKNENRI